MRTISVCCLALLACDGKSRLATQMENLQQRKDDLKKAKEEKNKPAVVPEAKLDAPYSNASATVLLPDAPCPAGFWALFPGAAPGATPEEKKSNEAKRKELATGLLAATYLVKLRGPSLVKLSAFDAPKGTFQVDVVGSVDCIDSAGHVTISWTNAQAGDPGSSAAKEGVELRQRFWLAPPTVFSIPKASMTEAKEFESKNKVALSARIVGAAGEVEVDKKLIKMQKVETKAAGETVGYGGGMEDWGAGRLLRLNVAGFRVATQLEAVELYETKTLAK
jgi:hypothetical protein